MLAFLVTWLQCTNICLRNRRWCMTDWKLADMKLFRATYVSVCAYAQFIAGSPLPCMLQVYDVLKPNKHFSKGKPDDPRLAVCLATSAYVPTRSVLQHLQDQVSPVPLQFARVAGGEVSFHSIQGLS